MNWYHLCDSAKDLKKLINSNIQHQTHQRIHYWPLLQHFSSQICIYTLPVLVCCHWWKSIPLQCIQWLNTTPRVNCLNCIVDAVTISYAWQHFTQTKNLFLLIFDYKTIWISPSSHHFEYTTWAQLYLFSTSISHWIFLFILLQLWADKPQ